MSCRSAPPLCSVLEAGHRTCGHNIRVSKGDQIDGRDLTLVGEGSLNLITDGQLNLSSEASLNLNSAGPITLGAHDFTVTATENLSLTAGAGELALTGYTTAIGSETTISVIADLAVQISAPQLNVLTNQTTLASFESTSISSGDISLTGNQIQITGVKSGPSVTGQVVISATDADVANNDSLLVVDPDAGFSFYASNGLPATAASSSDPKIQQFLKQKPSVAKLQKFLQDRAAADPALRKPKSQKTGAPASSSVSKIVHQSPLEGGRRGPTSSSSSRTASRVKAQQGEVIGIQGLNSETFSVGFASTVAPPPAALALSANGFYYLLADTGSLNYETSVTLGSPVTTINSAEVDIISNTTEIFATKVGSTTAAPISLSTSSSIDSNSTFLTLDPDTGFNLVSISNNAGSASFPPAIQKVLDRKPIRPKTDPVKKPTSVPRSAPPASSSSPASSSGASTQQTSDVGILGFDSANFGVIFGNNVVSPTASLSLSAEGVYNLLAVTGAVTYSTSLGLTSPLSTVTGNVVINGNLTLNGTFIYNPPPPPEPLILTRIMPAQVSGGDTVVGPDWIDLPLSLEPCYSLQPGRYRVEGFVTFYGESREDCSVARLLCGEQQLLGTGVAGSGLSWIRGRIEVRADTAPPFWWLQYKTNSSRIHGLGLPTGLADNVYISLEIQPL